MSEQIHWQLPKDKVLVVVYGTIQQFEVEGRCIAQGSAGFILEASPGSDAFAGLDVKSQFIPYSSIISVRVLSSDSAGGLVERKEREATRKDRVKGELEDLLGAPWQRPAEEAPPEATEPDAPDDMEEGESDG